MMNKGAGIPIGRAPLRCEANLRNQRTNYRISSRYEPSNSSRGMARNSSCT